MCEATYDGNKVQVCTVGELKPGDTYRTPVGETMLVVNMHILAQVGEVDVVDTTTGKVTTARKDTKLGRDHAGRLYASRSLNDPQPVVVPAAGNFLGLTGKPLNLDQ